MKFASIMLLIIFLASCDSLDDDFLNLSTATLEGETGIIAYMPEVDIPVTDAVTVPAGGVGLTYDQIYNTTLQQILYDFDYLIKTMEYAFPYFGVVERRLGVDLRKLSVEIRDQIKNYPYSMMDFANEIGLPIEEIPELDEFVFWSILNRDFFGPIAPFAHLNVISFFWGDLSTTGSNRNTIDMSFFRNQETLFHELIPYNLELIEFYFNFEPTTSLEIIENLEQTTSGIIRAFDNEPVLNTKIIEEGRIAYMELGNFMIDPRGFAQSLFDFYETIKDYKYLIIDMRYSGGGNAHTGPILVMYPLFYGNVEDGYMYAFFTSYDQARYLRNMIRLRQTLRVVGHSILSTYELLETNYLPHFNRSDASYLPYAVKVNININNITRGNINLLSNAWGFDIPRIPFSGEIFLLTSRLNYSASANFAVIAKETGFATLVGEQVLGGLTATSPYYFSLPNTGIVVSWDRDYLTDRYGRAYLEYLPNPHYFNMPGKDALETAIYIINSR